MWPHYWLGYLLLVLGAVHSALPMRQGGLRGQNMTGIWLGTLGLAALLLETVLGLYLQDTALSERRPMRSWHYWLMCGNPDGQHACVAERVNARRGRFTMFA